MYISTYIKNKQLNIAINTTKTDILRYKKMMMKNLHSMPAQVHTHQTQKRL